MRPRWVMPRLPPSPMTFTRRSRAVHPDAVVGLVPHLGVGLRAGLDVGADAAVVEQVHRCQQDGPQQFRRAQPRVTLRQAQHLADLCADTGMDLTCRGHRLPPPSLISDAS